MTPLHLALYLVNNNGDLNLMDSYRCLCLHLLESSDIGNQIPRSRATENSDLRNSLKVKRIRAAICRIVHRIRERKLPCTDPAMNMLGKCFLFLGDLDSPATAFELGILSSSPLRHDAICDACKSKGGIVGTRYVCFSCADTDLCEGCYKKYTSQHINVKRYLEHEFLEIPGTVYTAMQVEQSIQGLRSSKWLEVVTYLCE